MTKYKEFMRAHGTKLACDFNYLPYKGLESIETRVMDACVVAIAHFNNTTPQYVVYDRYGECDYYDGPDYNAHIEKTRCPYEYTTCIQTACHMLPRSVYKTVITAMEDLYTDNAKVRTAFKHLKADIMAPIAFSKLLAKYCKKLTAIELTVEC